MKKKLEVDNLEIDSLELDKVIKEFSSATQKTVVDIETEETVTTVTEEIISADKQNIEEVEIKVEADSIHKEEVEVVETSTEKEEKMTEETKGAVELETTKTAEVETTKTVEVEATKAAELETPKTAEVAQPTFKETGLKNSILDAIGEMGFVTPTPIQARTIKHLLNSERDLIATAQTGTGKTAAFGLPVVDKIDASDKSIQAIILCPTRELCLQISRNMETFAKNLKGFRVNAVYGGASIDTQIKALNKGGQVVVGTPGRTLDLIKRGRLKLGNVRYLVLDEADEMLSMGFQDDLDDILATVPDQRQTLLFSATMPNEVYTIAKKYMQDAERITVMQKDITTTNVHHAYYMAMAKDRYVALKRVVDLHPKIYGIIFCRTRQETKDVAAKLSHDGYNSDALHGDLSQAQRDYVMDKFRKQQLQLLVATDVAARGLDVNNLTHVINYNLPDEAETYIHRSGRTGRGDKSGTSLSIIHTREKGKIKTIENKMKKKMEVRQIPLGGEICQIQLLNLADRIENTEIDEQQISVFMDKIYEKFDHLSKEELIKKFISVEFNRFLNYYKNAKDINVKDDGGRRGGGFDLYSINIGDNELSDQTALIGLINRALPGIRVKIGRIAISNKFSTIELDSDYRKEIEAAFSTLEVDGKPVAFECAPGVVSSDDRRGRGGRGGGGGRGRGGDRGGRGGRGGDRGGRGGYRSEGGRGRGEGGGRSEGGRGRSEGGRGRSEGGRGGYRSEGGRSEGGRGRSEGGRGGYRSEGGRSGGRPNRDGGSSNGSGTPGRRRSQR